MVDRLRMVNPLFRFAEMLVGLLALLLLIAPRIGMAHEALFKENIIKLLIYPYQSPKAIIDLYGPLGARLEKKLGKKVEIFSAEDSKTFFEKAQHGDYDILYSSPTAYYKLKPSGFKVIAKGVPTFYGGVIVRKESEIRAVEDLKGKKVAAIGNFSYAGYQFVLPPLAAKGIDPQEEVEFSFLEKVDTIVFGVINKKYDAGMLRIDALERPVFAAVRDLIRIVIRSPEIPQFPFVVRGSTDATTVAAIQEALTTISPEQSEDKELLQKMQIDKIVVATDADYDAFYEQVKDADFFKNP
jgi:phosphonate transport system substrate-binding protein